MSDVVNLVRPKLHTKFTTSGAHDVIVITSPQKNDLSPKSNEIKPSHWTRSVYHLEKLDSVVYCLGRERELWS